MDDVKQLRLEDTDEEYKAFVEKFKLKKTTDDCYTPENIYDAVKKWCCKEYNINESDIVRPFWPGRDYENYAYEENAVVVDNPPFSIITKICEYYVRRGIAFFLFAPYLTNFSIGRGDARIQHIITGMNIVYENGANIPTSFVTNMDKWYIRTANDLMAALDEEDKANRNRKKSMSRLINTPQKY